MTRLDKDALKRAMPIAMAISPATKEQLEAFLEEGRSWEEVAEAAARYCQRKALDLKPWEPAPCSVDEEELINPKSEYERNAQAMLRKMLAANISRYEPDPMAALPKR